MNFNNPIIFKNQISSFTEYLPQIEYGYFRASLYFLNSCPSFPKAYLNFEENKPTETENKLLESPVTLPLYLPPFSKFNLHSNRYFG